MLNVSFVRVIICKHAFYKRGLALNAQMGNTSTIWSRVGDLTSFTMVVKSRSWEYTCGRDDECLWS